MAPAPHLATPWSHLWMPEHSMQSSTPRLMLAQRGSGRPQSPHWLFPATCCMRCSTLSPLTLRSRESVAESMLLVDGDAVRSSLWRQGEGSLSPMGAPAPVSPAGPLLLPRRRCWHRPRPLRPEPAPACVHTRSRARTHDAHACSRAACGSCARVCRALEGPPHGSSCRGSPGRRTRCWLAQPEPTPAAASLSRPAACSSCGEGPSGRAGRGSLRARPGPGLLTWWATRPQSRTCAQRPHRASRSRAGGHPPPRSARPAGGTAVALALSAQPCPAPTAHPLLCSRDADRLRLEWPLSLATQALVPVSTLSPVTPPTDRPPQGLVGRPRSLLPGPSAP